MTVVSVSGVRMQSDQGTKVSVAGGGHPSLQCVASEEQGTCSSFFDGTLGRDFLVYSIYNFARLPCPLIVTITIFITINDPL